MRVFGSPMPMAKALIPEGYAYVPGQLYHLVIRAHLFGNSCNILQCVMSHAIAYKRHTDAVNIILDELRCMYAKLGSQYPVICAGAAAPLDVAGYDGTGLDSHHFR